MTVEKPEQHVGPARKRPLNTILIAAALLIAAFLAGYVPSSVKSRRLEGDLREARQAVRLAQLRDLAGLAYLQATQKDYGLAAGTCARFFERTREAANQMPDPGGRKALEDILSGRDALTSELAKGEPGILNDLQILFVKTRQATEIASGTAQP